MSEHAASTWGDYKVQHGIGDVDPETLAYIEALLARMERLEAVEFEARQARASGYRTSACQRIDAALDAAESRSSDE